MAVTPTWTAIRAAATVLTCVATGAVIAAAQPDTGDAQVGRNLEPPPAWRVQYDAPGPPRGVVVMRPGWLIRPGRAAIFWDPDWRASGAYTVSFTASLFPADVGMPPSSVDAPYGLVVGASGLGSRAAAYAAFVVRNDGRFAIEQRTAAGVDMVVPWTNHDRIAVLSAESVGVARNRLEIDVGVDLLTFRINGAEVARLPRERLPFAGAAVGVRAGDGLALHVRDLSIVVDIEKMPEAHRTSSPSS